MAGNKIFRVLTSIFFKGKIYSEGSLIEVTSEEYIKCFDNEKKLVEYVKDVETPKVETEEVETPPQPSPEGREEDVKTPKEETPKVEIHISDEMKETVAKATVAKYPIQKNGAKK